MENVLKYKVFQKLGEKMKKIAFFSMCLGLGLSVFAGMVDHEEYIDFPNVNVDAHLLKIARHYYPDARPDLPEGLAPEAAWEQDIKKAAEGLNIPQEQLQKLIEFVINPRDNKIVKAPHEKLLEFELYGKGKRVLSHTKAIVPPSWTELFSLPIEQRRYTTIPALYCLDRCDIPIKDGGSSDYLEQITEARKKGCADTQGLERILIQYLLDCYQMADVEFDKDFDLNKIGQYYQRLLREFAMNWIAVKQWRYTNNTDTWRWAAYRGDRFYSGREMPPLRFLIYIEKDENLRELCKQIPSFRDFVVAIGLTNRQMFSARKIAAEFAYQSPINYPVLALRVPLDEAEKLLAGKPEHASLLAQLRLKQLSGMEKIKAINDYIATYKDYTEDDMPTTSIALYTYTELHALAGLEYYKMGNYQEALKHWVKGGTPEDIGLIAEQLFSLDELVDFCRNYTTDTITDDYDVTSEQCNKDNKGLYPNILDGIKAEYALRNILARRLMREKRYDEARQWFTGHFQRYYSEQFFQLFETLNNAKGDQKSKLEACLTLAALIRYKGDFLFGTFLEPDNVICNGEYACEWGVRIPNPKLQKPKLPRFHYRWIAADYYRKAAVWADDPKLKEFCFWMAGTLLKVRDIKLANTDFLQLVKLESSLITGDWFKKLDDVPENVQQWFQQRVFIFGSERIAAWKPNLPPVEKVELPENDGSAETLLKLGVELYNKTKYIESAEYKQAMYALFLAGQKGLSDGYFWCGVMQNTGLSKNEAGIAFFKRALELDPASQKTKHELGRAYLDIGLWQDGVALIKHVADTEQKDKELLGMAAYNMSKFYREGEVGLKEDAEKAAYYLKKSADAGLPQAIKLLEKGE